MSTAARSHGLTVAARRDKLTVMTTHATFAPAKINLMLHVRGRRPDGYHEIESLIAHVALYDRVTVTARTGPLRIECRDPRIPADERNLAHKAAHTLLAAAGRSPADVAIRLEKHIPAGAGLGGGSSDAAAVLMLINKMLRLGFAREQLAQIGAQLGADVPLFLHASPCIVRGIGHAIEPLSRALAGFATLIMPPLHCATPAVYQAWTRTGTPDERPSAAALLAASSDVATLMPSLYNDLEAAAMTVEPALAPLHVELVKLAGGPVRMSGSGASFFRLFDQEQDARTFADLVAAKLHIPAAAVALR